MCNSKKSEDVADSETINDLMTVKLGSLVGKAWRGEKCGTTIYFEKLKNNEKSLLKAGFIIVE